MNQPDSLTVDICKLPSLKYRNPRFFCLHGCLPYWTTSLVESGTLSFLTLDVHDLHSGEGKGEGREAGDREEVLIEQQMEKRGKEDRKAGHLLWLCLFTAQGGTDRIRPTGAESQATLCSPGQKPCLASASFTCLSCPHLLPTPEKAFFLILTKVPSGPGLNGKTFYLGNMIFFNISICFNLQENSHNFVRICHSGL